MKEQKPSICLNALLIQNHLEGIGNYAYQLALLLTRNHPEWEIHLLVHRGVSPRFRNIPGLRIMEVGISSRLGRLLFLHLVFPFISGRYSIVHSVGNMGLVFGRVRQVITIHDTYEWVSPERFSRFKRGLMRLLISVSGRKAVRIVTDSMNSKRDIEKYYPHLSSKLSVIYLGNKFPLQLDARVGGRKNFIFVGTVEPGKNLAFVLEAFSHFRKSHTEKMMIVGAMGWRQSHLPGLIESLGIEDSVEFLGYVPDEQLQKLYAGSLALIQASTYEGFGLPVIEAMACGCPVIAAHNSGLIEAGGDSALFFRTNDRVDLVRQMETVHGNSLLREQCIQSGFLHAARFTWEKTATETAVIYESLLSQYTHH